MLRYLLEKEFKQILRHRFLPRVILFMPFMMLGVLPFAANQEVKEVRVAVLDNDHSTTSRRLIEKVKGSGYFQLVALPKGYQEALQGVEAGETDIILELPRDLEKTIVQGEGSQVLLAANAVNGTRGILGSTYLSSVLHDYASELRQAGVGSAERGAYTALPTFTLQSQYQFNPHLDYKAFMVPGLMVMLLTMRTGFLPALNIVGEKETGTIEQMNVSPVRPWTLILSKLIPYWTLGLFVLMLAMGLAATLFGLTPAGDVGAGDMCVEYCRDDAAGDVRHVLLHDALLPNEWTLHPHYEYAPVGTDADLPQSPTLLRPSDAKHLPQGEWAHGSTPTARCTRRLCPSLLLPSPPLLSQEELREKCRSPNRQVRDTLLHLFRDNL